STGSHGGGDVTAIAQNGLTLTGVNSSASSQGAKAGNITLFNGSGVLTPGDLTASGIVSGGKADGGTVLITSGGTVQLSNVNTTGRQQGGDVAVVSRSAVSQNSGNIDTSASASSGAAGGIYVSSAGTITLGNLTANGGNGSGTGGDILLTTAGSLAGAPVRGSVSNAGSTPGDLQEFYAGNPPPFGVLPTAFANAASITIRPQQLPSSE